LGTVKLDTTPAVVIRPTESDKLLKHRAPSGPTVIAWPDHARVRKIGHHARGSDPSDRVVVDIGEPQGAVRPGDPSGAVDARVGEIGHHSPDIQRLPSTQRSF